jgi:hypothetical protein
MGLFWDYFRDTLRFGPISKPGALAMLADGASALLDGTRDVALQLRDQFSPVRCEDAYLARFAASRGIVRNTLETDDHWLMRVRFAYRWYARGGRASAMAETLRVGFGFASVEVINAKIGGPLYDETTGYTLVDETTGAQLIYDNSDRWAEFVVIVTLDTPTSVYDKEQLLWAVNEVKPARSKCAAIIVLTPLSDETTGEILEGNNGPLTG